MWPLRSLAGVPESFIPLEKLGILPGIGSTYKEVSWVGILSRVSILDIFSL